jgi:hypothetical protein
MAVRAPRFPKLRTDSKCGVERGEWALKHQAKRASAQGSQFLFAHREKVAALEHYFAFYNGALAPQQSDDCHRQSAFAGSALPNQSNDFTACDF